MKTMWSMPDAAGCGNWWPSGHCCAYAIDCRPRNSATEAAIAACRRTNEMFMERSLATESISYWGGRFRLGALQARSRLPQRGAPRAMGTQNEKWQSCRRIVQPRRFDLDKIEGRVPPSA